MKFEIVQIHFLIEVSVCCRPEIFVMKLLPHSIQSYSNIIVRYCH